MNAVDRLGMERVLTESLEFLAGAPFLHLSLDLDAVDPMFAPGVGTPVRGGLSYREAHLAMELLAESNRLDSLEVVEVNPILDRENETGALAVELVASALGARLRPKMRAFGRTTPLTILAKPVTPEQFEAALQAAL